MTLDVIIGTYKPEGMKKLSALNLPVADNVNYIISWQAHENFPIPEKLLRHDIKIYRTEGIGLSNNRNNAIEHSEADIIYVTDDDVILLPEALEKIIKRFEEYPDTQVATFMMKENEKVYPKVVTDLTFYLPKNYNVVSYEIAFKRELFNEIRFDTRYGINSGVFEAGEDELFHLEARKKGFKCRFFPDIIASHPDESTGIRKVSDPKVIHAFAAIIVKSYPRSFFFRFPLKAYRLKKNKQYPFILSLKELIKGWKKVRNENINTSVKRN